MKDSADFHLQYANRQGQDVFAHEMPQYTPEMLELLQRHGFFYQNPGDCAGGHMPSGDRSAAWAAANWKSVCRGTWSDRSGRQTGYHGRIHAAAPAFYCGNTAAGWRTVQATEQAIMQPGISNHFNQCLTYSYDGTRSGLPYYMTAPASWNVLEALAGLQADLAAGILSLAPVGDRELRLPVFLPHAWFEIRRSAEGTALTLLTIRALAPCRFSVLKLAGTWCADGAVVHHADGVSILELEFDPGRQTLTCRKM